MQAIFNINYEATRQIKKLMAVISRIGPFKPNVSKLANQMTMSRTSILKYIDYLTEADIMNALKSEAKSDNALTKPDKIYFENTNLLYAFDASMVNEGTLRETFVMNVLNKSELPSTPSKGDFLVNQKYVVEVGGKSKDFRLIKGMGNTLLIKEGIGRGAKDIIPMWSLGFLKVKNR